MDTIYSVKMRAAEEKDHLLGGKHISGAERLIKEEELVKICGEMVVRALKHPKGKADFINITIQNLIQESILKLEALPIIEKVAEPSPKVSKVAEPSPKEILKEIGVAEPSRLLEKLASISNMRGAMILDIKTLERLDDLGQRGVRVTKMDYAPHLKIENYLEAHGFKGKYLKDALALATKVCNGPGVVAEICWSDDPQYTTGYIATKKQGYIRLPHFKPEGHTEGGRIILVDSSQTSVEKLIDYLQKQAVMIQSYPHFKSW